MAAGAACNRSETETQTKQVAADVKAAAAKAGDQLADTWITTKIQAQYFADDDIKARYINVSTRGGVVTLSGRVEHPDAREQAIQIARLTDGVKQVDDRLSVGAPPPEGGPFEKMDSAWITTKIQAKYFASPDVGSRDINVTTTNGVVTLRGTVENDDEKQMAIFMARNTEGVTTVEDRLSVKAPRPVATTGGAPASMPAEMARRIVDTIDDARITGMVQSKYFLDDQVKGRRINVDTRQGVVTLRGEVGSETERAQALLLARTTEGVQRVEDHLSVNASLAAPVATTGQPTDERSLAERIDDTTLTAMIQSKFFVDNQVKASAIDVTAKDGVVLLQGTVPSEAARAKALAIARETDGVVQVVDRLRVARK
jgi:osmotically-inducible protein OsmY